MNPLTIADPIKLAKTLWPHLKLSVEQQHIIYSFEDNRETYVAAANMMGKDFIAALCAVLAFLRKTPCRGVTTSAKDDHLKVLWGEIHNFIETSAFPLEVEKGGPLIVLQQELRKIDPATGKECPKSYVIGMVASEQTEAALQGHHIGQTGDGIWRTFFIGDESSSLHNRIKKMCSSWANRELYIGNTWPCENFFRYAFEGKPGTEDKGGDIPRKSGKGFVRKVFQLDVEHSPNVQFARWQQSQGIEPDNTIVVPGMKPWAEFQENLQVWDPEEQAVKLYAKWYKGKELKLFPGEWLSHAEVLADALRGQRRIAKSGGCDPGEGSANTAFCAGDEYGVIEKYSIKTPDTNDIFFEAKAFIDKHRIPCERFCVDRGGGGKQLADRLRAAGYPVRTVAFGESIGDMPQRVRLPLRNRVETKEERYTFINRRSQLYGDLSEILDPHGWWFLPVQCIEKPTPEDVKLGGRHMAGFSIPRWYPEYRAQLEPIPKKRDGEGRLLLPPKHKKDPNDKTVTLVDLIGHSPDEADALVLMVHGLLHPVRRSVAMVG